MTIRRGDIRTIADQRLFDALRAAAHCGNQPDLIRLAHHARREDWTWQLIARAAECDTRKAREYGGWTYTQSGTDYLRPRPLKWSYNDE